MWGYRGVKITRGMHLYTAHSIKMCSNYFFNLAALLLSSPVEPALNLFQGHSLVRFVLY